MTQHWIFVLLPFSDFNRGDIPETLKRVKDLGKWPIGKSTLHRKQLSKGDKVLFYQAGEEGKKFIGSGELLSNLVHEKQIFSDYVEMGDVNFWAKSVPIAGLIDDLSFIKNKRNWGLHFQGGIIRVSENDYQFILKKGKSRKSIKKGKSSLPSGSSELTHS